MTGRVTIALDAMGGDQAPEMVFEGAEVALQRHPDLHFLFVGEEQRLATLLNRHGQLIGTSEIRLSESVVNSTDKPAIALRQGRRSSMRIAIDAVRDGDAYGVVSAGNTGVLMAMAKTVLKSLPGIHRPAIGSLFPTMKGETVMLDLGANIDCSAENLFEFAIMGDVFARNVLGIVDPSVGLLNVGIESNKGNEIVRAAADLLRSQQLSINFHGFVEGDDITAGTVDVVVCDGFTGNVALKTAEGTARLYSEFLKATFNESVFSRLGYLLAKPALASLRERVDPRRYNGGIFLGLNGIAVKSHGASDALAFANAIGFAYDMATHGFSETVIGELNRWYAGQTDNAEAAAR